MAGHGLTAEERWFEAHSGGAPAPLRERVAGYLAARPASDGRAERLSDAATDALAVVLAHPGDRSVALDLLAADALVTLALQARAGSDPGTLARFAAGLRESRDASG